MVKKTTARVAFSFTQVAAAPDETSTMSLSAFAAELGLGPHIEKARRELADIIGRSQPPTIRILRLRAGLSQQDLARRLGTSQARISTIESGREGMGFEFAYKMARELGVSTDALYEAISENGGG